MKPIHTHQMTAPFIRFGKAWRQWMDQNPKLGSACTGFCMYALGDVIAQGLHQKRHPHGEGIRLLQSAQVGCLGFVSNGVFLSNWYRYLDRALGSSMTSKKGVILKVLADQVVYAPLMISSYFAFFCAIRNHSLNDFCEALVNKLKHSLVNTWLADCALWPVANAINFRYIPLNFRPVWTSFIQLLWQTYLAYVSTTSSNVAIIEVADPGD
eukprot:scaffold4392_cov187-Ochromonas_danica.AAC.1